MSAPTLTEFLLARIAEDEHYGTHDRAMQERLDRECEAKRRIVNAHRSGFPDWDRYSAGWHDMHIWALCQMAAVYADHPDYDEEWRL